MTRLYQSITPRCVTFTGINIHLLRKILIDKVELHATGEIEFFEQEDLMRFYFWSSIKELSDLNSDVEKSAFNVDIKVDEFVQSIWSENTVFKHKEEHT